MNSKNYVCEEKITELGYALKSYRVRNNITQTELAAFLGVSCNTVCLWETRMRKPTIRSLVILSELLNEPLPSLIKKSEKEFC